LIQPAWFCANVAVGPSAALFLIAGLFEIPCYREISGEISLLQAEQGNLPQAFDITKQFKVENQT
jgi:hypothetical protein